MNPRGYRAGRGSIRVSLDFGQHPKERDKKKKKMKSCTFLIQGSKGRKIAS